MKRQRMVKQGTRDGGSGTGISGKAAGCGGVKSSYYGKGVKMSRKWILVSLIGRLVMVNTCAVQCEMWKVLSKDCGVIIEQCAPESEECPEVGDKKGLLSAGGESEKSIVCPATPKPDSEKPALIRKEREGGKIQLARYIATAEERKRDVLYEGGKKISVNREERRNEERSVGRVVTANRVEYPLPDLPVLVDVITREDIERTNAKTVADAIVRNCAADIISYPQVLSDIGIRGFAPAAGTGPRRCTVLINGRNAMTKNLSTILVDDIERIEILRGPASYLYGSGGMGGAVNIITRHSAGPGTTLGYEFRTFMAWKAFLHTSGSAPGNRDYDLTLIGSGEKEYPVPPADRLWKGNEYNPYGGSFRYGFDLLPNHHFECRADAFLVNGMDYAGDFYGKLGPGRKDMSRCTYDIAYTGCTPDKEHQWQARVAGGNDVSADKLQERSNRDTAGSMRTDYLNISVQDREQLSMFSESIFGFDYNYDKSITCRYDCKAGRIAPLVPDFERLNFAFFGVLRTKILNNRLILDAGCRYDGFKLQVLPTSFLGNTFSEEYSYSFDPRVALAYRFVNWAQLHCSAGTGFVVPEPYQKTGSYTPSSDPDTRTTFGNEGLRPEKSVGYDAGLTFNFPAGSTDITFFYSSLTGGIEKTDTGETLTFKNVVDKESYGIEGNVSIFLSDIWKWNRLVRVYANMAWLMKNRDITNDRNVYNVARLKVNWGLEYEGERLDARLNWRYLGDRRDITTLITGFPREVQTGNINVVDINLKYKIIEHLYFLIKVDNVLNERIEDKYGYPLPGRVGLGAIELVF